MKTSTIDMTGFKVGRLTVIGRAAKEGRFGKKAGWLCKCECGKEASIVGWTLRSGATKSCGCLRDDSTRSRFSKHGLSGRREYQSWLGAKTRCFNPNQESYKYYGGRGITMCQRWQDSFQAFFDDMGKCPRGQTLDRIDRNGNYEPSNCRWATLEQQANNRSITHWITLNGKTHSIAQWERFLGFKPGVVKRRILLGWDETSALLTPVKTRSVTVAP